MRSAAYRVVSLVLAAVFVLSGLVSGTLGWQSLSQQARNETQSKIVQDVELLKLQKLPDGTENQIPVPGAVFYLFTADGVQIGGRYVTNSEGKIPVRLEPGSYYFEEFSPAPGFTFDKDADATASPGIPSPSPKMTPRRWLSPPTMSGCKGRSPLKRLSRMQTAPL